MLHILTATCIDQAVFCTVRLQLSPNIIVIIIIIIGTRRLMWHKQNSF